MGKIQNEVFYPLKTQTDTEIKFSAFSVFRGLIMMTSLHKRISILLLLIFILFQNVYSGDSTKYKKIILTGDSQRRYKWELFRENNDGIAKKIFDQIALENPAIVIHLGDMVDDGSSENSWIEFKDDASELLKTKIPIYPVLGNHEYFGNNPKAMNNLNTNFPHLKNKTWYSLQVESMGIILTNSNFDELSKEENLLQLSWYNNKLKEFEQDSVIKTILVACHHSPYTNSRIVSANKLVQTNFVNPFLLTAKGRLFFSGHAHAYEHFINNEKHFIVSGGGGGPRQKLKIKHPEYTDVFKGNEIRDFHFCEITFLKNELEIKMMRLDLSTSKFQVGDTFVVD